jgi:CheY-like chemotaxis protein
MRVGIAEAPHMDRSQPGDDVAGAKPTVLVVDDVVLVRLLVADYLRESGYRVIEAGSTEDAIRVLGHQGPIDIVFSDVNMPGTEDGFGLARWVRQNLPGVKVVLGSGVPATTEKAAALHYNEPILPKPYDHRKLERLLHDVLAGIIH